MTILSKNLRSALTFLSHQQYSNPDSVVLFQHTIEESFNDLNSSQLKKLAEKFSNNSIVLFFAATDDSKFLIYWKSNKTKIFLTLKPYKKVFSANDKSTCVFVIDFLQYSLKNGHLGIKKGLSFQKNNGIVELHELADSQGHNLLLVASKTGVSEPISNLVKCGIPSRSEDDENITAQVLAKEGKHFDVLLKLLQENLSFPPSIDKNDCSDDLKKFIEMSEEFHKMIAAKNIQKLDEIIKENPNLSYFYNKANKSALNVALDKELIEMYDFFISKNLRFGPDENFDRTIKIFSPKIKRKVYEIHVKYSKPLPSNHINILMANTTLTHDETDEEGKKEIVQRLYNSLNEDPLLNIILRAVAASKLMHIVFDFFEDSVHRVDPNNTEITKGTFDLQNRITVGAKKLLDPTTEHEVYGTLAHELCHFAMFVGFENDAKSYRKNDEDAEKYLDKIIAICEKNKEMEKYIKLVYDGKRFNYPAELIVRPAHLIALYRNQPEILQEKIKQFPELFDYFKKVIGELEKLLPEIEARLRPSYTFSKLSKQNKGNVKNADVMYKNVKLHLSDIISEKSDIFEKLLPDHIAQMLEGKILNFDDPHLHYLDELLVFGWEKLAKNLKNKLLNSDLSYQGEVISFKSLNATNPNSFRFLTSDQIRDILSGSKIVVGKILKSDVEFYVMRKFILEDLKLIYFEYTIGHDFHDDDPTRLEYHRVVRQLLRTFEVFYYDFIKLGISKRKKIYQKIKENNIFKISSYDSSNIDLVFLHKSSSEIIEQARSDRIFILSSEAGAGKTVSFENLAIQIKKKFPAMWVSYIDIKDFTKIYNPSKSSDELLTEILNLNSKNEFEMKIFQESYSKGKVVLLWNGFDEISPTNNEFVLNTMKDIHENSKNIQYICTRPIYSDELSTAFEVRPWQLVSFDINEKTHFLKEMLKSQNLSDIEISKNIKKIQKFIVKAEAVNPEVYSFNTPLLLKLFSEIYDVEASIDSPNLYQVFETFVDKKIEIWLGKSENSISKANKCRRIGVIEEIYQKYGLLLLMRIFSYGTLVLKLKKLQIMQQNIADVLPYGEIFLMGILYINGQNEFEFAHKTFGEFFIAKYFIDKIYNADDNLTDEEALMRLELFCNFIIDYENDQKMIINFINAYLSLHKSKSSKKFSKKISQLFRTKFKNLFVRMLDGYFLEVFEFLFNFFKKDHNLLVDLLQVNEDETLYTAIFNPNHFAYNINPEDLKKLVKKYLTDEEFQKFVRGKNQKGKFLFGFFFYGLLGAPKINYDYISDIKALKVTSFWEFPIKIKAVLTINEQKELFKMLMIPKIFLFYNKMFSHFGFDGYENIWKNYENLLTTNEMQIAIGNAFIQFLEFLPLAMDNSNFFLLILMEKSRKLLSNSQIKEMFKINFILHEAHSVDKFFEAIWALFELQTTNEERREILLQEYSSIRNVGTYFRHDDIKNVFSSYKFPIHYYDFCSFNNLHRSIITYYAINFDFTLKIYREYFSKAEIQKIVLSSTDFIFYIIGKVVDLGQKSPCVKIASFLEELFIGNEKSLKEYFERKIYPTDMTVFEYVDSFKGLSCTYSEWFDHIKPFADLYDKVKKF